MNIFKKIAIFNKVTRIITQIKDYFERTRLDKEMKEIITSIKSDVEKLIQKAPELKEAYLFIKDLLK